MTNSHPNEHVKRNLETSPIKLKPYCTVVTLVKKKYLPDWLTWSRDSIVGTATSHGLDGPRIESR
jgi:hypothetical protein